MNKMTNKEIRDVVCMDCITGKSAAYHFSDDRLIDLIEVQHSENDKLLVAPGLIDLQVNGINGIDFNDPGLTSDDVVEATLYLLSIGVTTFLPTVITNSDENIMTIVRSINEACLSNDVVNDCVYGIHLEGPFMSPEDGAKGAHDKQYIKPPDWHLFEKFQQAAGGRIKLITIAPEWEETTLFIKKCRLNGVIVSLGHSMANTLHINSAVNAGATMCTHLGNGVPLLLPRHPNIIWDQLAADELYACIITDGIHIPDSFIKAVMKIKTRSTIVVSDATCFAGMPPGEYQNHIGGTVIVDKEKRVSLKSTPGLLAGAGKTLLENVAYLTEKNLASIGEAWRMASQNVSNMLAKNDRSFKIKNDDFVMFRLTGKDIKIERVIKSGRIVFEQL